MLSVVVPMYDEEQVVELFVERLRPVLDAGGEPYEVVVVDDGSRDTTPVLLERYRREWPELRVVRLRANAGHQAALSAGLSRARGDWVVTMDADLQDPPELVPDMVAAARRTGSDVVYAARADRSTDTSFKRHTAALYYGLMRRLAGARVPSNAGDFRMMSRATVDAVNALPEHNRVLRLAVPALAFPSTTVTYERAERAAGRTKYSLTRMVRLSLDSVTGFSVLPLRVATWLGFLGILVSLVLIAYALISWLAGVVTPGWTSTFATVVGVGALQLFCLGLLGEYVGRMYLAMQGRPAYFVAYDSAERGDDAESEDVPASLSG
ncbi:MAG: glycosyltransferase family 2 protein [Streptosporangiales bacterium]|nr:glycosyltransferase family 2 protein [Streptosporangiales bacterium]MBO0889648.1 glycosyltransferase family 2 protein [Acidothermales bacterium]